MLLLLLCQFVLKLRDDFPHPSTSETDGMGFSSKACGLQSQAVMLGVVPRSPGFGVGVRRWKNFVGVTVNSKTKLVNL